MPSVLPHQAYLRLQLASQELASLQAQVAELSKQIAEYRDEPCPAYLADCQRLSEAVLRASVDVAVLLGTPLEVIRNATK